MTRARPYNAVFRVLCLSRPLSFPRIKTREVIIIFGTSFRVLNSARPYKAAFFVLSVDQDLFRFHDFRPGRLSSVAEIFSAF